MLENILDQVSNHVYSKDLQGRYLYVNQQVCDLFGYPYQEIIGASDDKFFQADALHTIRSNDQQVIQSGESLEFYESHTASNGEERIFASKKHPLTNAQGEIIGLCGVSTDVTDNVRLQAKLRNQKALLDTVLDNASSYIFMKDQGFRYLYANQRLSEFFQRDLNEIIGKTDTEIMGEAGDIGCGPMDRQVFELAEKVSGQETFTDLNGNMRHYWTTKIPLLEEGKVTAMVGISTDITEVIALKQEYEQLANTDQITGISSRHHLFNTGHQALLNAANTNSPLVVIVFDVDHFKSINDNFGHQTGDRALATIAQCCQEVLRSQDIFGRYGGDEFVIILTHTQLQTAVDIVQRIQHKIANAKLAINDPQGNPLLISTSFGIARSQANLSLQQLLNKADKALYQAKEQGRNCYFVAE